MVKTEKSKTGLGKTTETEKKAGRVKLSDEDKEKRYNMQYVPRMEKRNADIETMNSDSEIKIETLKILSLDEWKEKNMPSGETKNEVFIRLAKKRLANFEKAVENLKQLSTYP